MILGLGPHASFSNKIWSIDIDPGTLRAVDSNGLVISDGPNRMRFSDFHYGDQSADWLMMDLGVRVFARLESNTLVVDFKSDRVGEFNWPILPAQANNRAYIFPFGEGSYVPAHDPSWSKYPAQKESIDTTEGLSMPFWGVDFGKGSLTYVLTNPFNNELAFTNANGSLATSFTHRFTNLHKVKAYGVRITLGPSGPIEPAKVYRRWLQQTGQFVPMREKIRKTPEAAKLLGAAHIYLWGDGASPKMLDLLHRNGFDRLWLGAPNWKELRNSPQTVAKAKKLGYLIGPYDSYDSVHSLDAKPDDTWETAQFDQKLYNTGGILLASGKMKTGFLGKGFYINEKSAEPYMKARVNNLAKEFNCNSWFIDCDAAGEFYEDHSPLHSASQEEEMQERLKRIAWIRDTHHLVIGSEGGAAYAASTIHFAHGIETPVFGWDDPALKSKDSLYYLGAYYPEGAPTLFFKQVPLKPDYYRFLFDPRFRLPLYQTVFHDSIVATHHWQNPTLKFSDQVVERSLTEQLYNVPPMLHLNLAEFKKHGDWIGKEYAFFSPLHKKLGLLPLTSFDWLTPDHSVQRTVFGDSTEMVANFGSATFDYKGWKILAKAVIALDSGKAKTFKP